MNISGRSNSRHWSSSHRSACRRYPSTTGNSPHCSTYHPAGICSPAPEPDKQTNSFHFPLLILLLFTHPGCECVYVLQVFFLFFGFFFRPSKNTRQPFSGTAERIFMKLLPNDTGENGVSNVVPKWGLGPPNNFLGVKN